MAPPAGFDTEQVRDRARKDLLYLLEGVSQAGLCCAYGPFLSPRAPLRPDLTVSPPTGARQEEPRHREEPRRPHRLVVKVSTLQDYGVDKFFFLEKQNADTSQRNVVFVARGECARHAQSIAGQLAPPSPPSSPPPSCPPPLSLSLPPSP